MVTYTTIFSGLFSRSLRLYAFAYGESREFSSGRSRLSANVERRRAGLGVYFVPGEKLQKLRRLARTSSRPRGERNPPTWRALDRARPRSITLKSERGPSRPRVNVAFVVASLRPRRRTSLHRRCIATARRISWRGAGPACAPSPRRVHGMGVVVHGVRLSNCSIANKSAAQLESASSYTRQRITTDRPRHAAPGRFVKKLRAAIFTIGRR